MPLCMGWKLDSNAGALVRSAARYSGSQAAHRNCASIWKACASVGGMDDRHNDWRFCVLHSVLLAALLMGGQWGVTPVTECAVRCKTERGLTAVLSCTRNELR